MIISCNDYALQYLSLFKHMLWQELCTLHVLWQVGYIHLVWLIVCKHIGIPQFLSWNLLPLPPASTSCTSNPETHMINLYTLYLLPCFNFFSSLENVYLVVYIIWLTVLAYTRRRYQRNIGQIFSIFFLYMYISRLCLELVELQRAVYIFFETENSP